MGDMRDEALTRAIAALGGDDGGTKALADAIGISSAAVSQWKRVPADRVLVVERVSGVPRWELRPDIYPPEEYARTAAAQ